MYWVMVIEKEIHTATRTQILNEAVYISHIANICYGRQPGLFNLGKVTHIIEGKL